MGSNKKHGLQSNVRYQLDNFLNGIAGSVYWKDKNGVYLGCNDAVLKKGNLTSKAQIIGKTDFDLWPAYADEIRKVDLDVMEQDKIIEVEEVIILKNGEKLYFSSLKAPLKNENENIVGIIGNSFDVTELKIARQNAEAASRAKTQFLALMSHELRIPLTGILSTASLLMEENVTIEEAKEFSRIIIHSGDYLLSTINNILDFAKLEADKYEIVLAQVDLRLLIEEVLAVLQSYAKEKGLELFIKICSDIPTILYTDPRALRHILTNLVSNAIKYTEKGFVNVDIKKISHSANTVLLDIIVQDTGIGIPQDKKEFIFDRFTQIENIYLRKSSRSGTGLGLSIVKKLTQLLNGEIKVESQIGKGSTFTLSCVFSLKPKE